jgi:hypothetical protein
MKINKNGLTLRDYFAGQALMSMLTEPQQFNKKTYSRCAVEAYKFADAMLDERD